MSVISFLISNIDPDGMFSIPWGAILNNVGNALSSIGRTTTQLIGYNDFVSGMSEPMYATTRTGPLAKLGSALNIAATILSMGMDAKAILDAACQYGEYNQPTDPCLSANCGVAVIISGPTLSNDGTCSYTNGIAGHSAIAVDNTVYSFEGNGKWVEYKYDDYIKHEKENRWLAEISISANQADVETYLKAKLSAQNSGTSQEDYNILTNSCVSNTLDALRAGGVEVANPNGLVTPDMLYEELTTAKCTMAYELNDPNFDSSFWGRLLYNGLNNLGLVDNISGQKLNTIDLFLNN